MVQYQMTYVVYESRDFERLGVYIPHVQVAQLQSTSLDAARAEGRERRASIKDCCTSVPAWTITRIGREVPLDELLRSCS